METIANFENKNIVQPIPPTPPKNIYKNLFFVFLALFLVTISVLITLLITKKQNLTEIETPTPTAIPTAIEKTNILKISDIQMDLPKSWSVISVSDNSAKILTGYNQYQVYLTLKLDKNNSIAQSSYKSAGTMTKTQYGDVFDVQGGGTKGWTGALINNDKYSFIWDIESNQPTPANPDGIWRPDDNVTSEILLNITKTVRPLNQTSDITQNWKTYNSLAGFSIKSPIYFYFYDNTTSKISGYFYSYDLNSNKYPETGGFPLNESKIDYLVTKNTDLNNYFEKNFSSNNYISQKEVTVSGYKAKLIKQKWETEGSTDATTYLIDKNGSVFSFTQIMASDSNQVSKDKFSLDFSKMIDTLKFN